MRNAILLVAVLATGCRSAPQPLDDSTERGEDRPYAALVAKHAGSPVGERLAVYLPLARQCHPPSPKGAWGEGNLAALAGDLADAGEYDVLDALELRLEADKKRALWYALTRTCVGDGDAKRDLLGKWARANPDAIVLARWRPGGMDYLFGRLENPEEEPYLRLRCAAEIVKSGDPGVLPRLRKSMSDTTPAIGGDLDHNEPDSDEPFNPATYDLLTVGDHVRFQVERLERVLR